MTDYVVKPIGFIRSELKQTEGAPLFYTEGAPNARLELLPAFGEGLDRLQAGDELIILTWLHLAAPGCTWRAATCSRSTRAVTPPTP
jgi:tRNA (Thr-GGU) A37 N-methylase